MKIYKESIDINLKNCIKFFFFIIYVIFVGALIIGGIGAGIVTLLPDDASKKCHLGYYAHCSFTPFSTLILFVMAIFGIILLLKLTKYLRKKYEYFIEKLNNENEINK